MADRVKRDSTAWWGETGRESNRPSLLGLVKNNTLDLRLAALLWLLMERRASVIFASTPDLTGRTAMLSALIDFIPTSVRPTYVYGPNFEIPELEEDVEPGSTYLLIPELGEDRESYLWGQPVRDLFKALEAGYAVCTTMHADSPEEAIQVLKSAPNKVIPHKRISCVDIVVNLRTIPGGRSVARRVAQVTLLLPEPSGPPKLVSLVGWEPDADRYLFMDAPSTADALSERLGMSTEQFDSELARLKRRLEAWQSIGTLTASDVRKAVAQYHKTLAD
jgi:flagellar protein FlaI